MSKMFEPEFPDAGAGEANGASAAVAVLLAEDSVSARLLTGALLKRIGCDVETVGDGLAALKSLDARPARIVFLDIDMPELDGIATAKRIRQMPPPACNAVLVALSGYADGGMPEAPEGLFDQSIAKPATRDRLRELVRSVSEGRIRTNASAALSEDQWSRLMAIAVREMRDISAKLEDAKDGRDIDRVRLIAHQLKGLAATFGSPEVAALATRLQDQARQHSALELSQDLTDLCAAVVKATLAVIQPKVAGDAPAPARATGR